MIPIQSNYPALNYSLSTETKTNSSNAWKYIATMTAFIATARIFLSINEKRHKKEFEKKLRLWRNDPEIQQDEDRKSKRKTAAERVTASIDPSPKTSMNLYAAPDTILRHQLQIVNLQLSTLPPMPIRNPIQNLDASMNPLTRSIELGSWNFLVSLSLSGCELSSSPDITKLPKLRFANFSRNFFTELPKIDAKSHPELVLDLRDNLIVNLTDPLEERPKTHKIYIKRNPLSNDSILKIAKLITKQKGPEWDDIIPKDPTNTVYIVLLKEVRTMEKIPKQIYELNGSFHIDLRGLPLQKNLLDELKLYHKIKKYHDPNRPKILYGRPQ